MIITIANEYLKVAVNTLGAELSSIYDLKANRENMWQGHPDIWMGHSPLLFPIVGRLKNDQFEYDGKIWPMKQHGIARRREFEVEIQKTDELKLTLAADEASLELYPFAFKLSMHYILEGNKLIVKHIVENTGDKLMYYSIGAHPGFNCKPGDAIVFSELETQDAIRLQLPEHLTSERRTPVFNNENRLILQADTFDEDTLIFKDYKSTYVTLERADGSSVRVDLGNATMLGLWSKPGAGLPYICIEPWLGVDDIVDASGKLEEKYMIETLRPGEVNTFEMGITIKG